MGVRRQHRKTLNSRPPMDTPHLHLYIHQFLPKNKGLTGHLPHSTRLEGPQSERQEKEMHGNKGNPPPLTPQTAIVEGITAQCTEKKLQFKGLTRL